MPTRRGWCSLGAGAGLWLVALFVGSPDLHAVAAGLIALPLLAVMFVRWSRVAIDVHRSLSQARVFPGAKVVVTLRVENRGRAILPFLLLQDAVPPSVGRPARLVVTGIPPQNTQTVSYSIVCRRRGLFDVGPLQLMFSDPFGLARAPIRTQAVSELVVYPEVEDIEPWRLGIQGQGAGESAARHLHRSAAEFYTMREYVTGDDLRRIHWPSVARTGQLMIRQDEATRRSSATLFLDNRSSALGSDGSPGFERAVSVAASLGKMLFASGFSIRLNSVNGPGGPVTEERLLEVLASMSPVRTKGLGETLTRLRATSQTDTALAVVTAVPHPPELAAIIRAGALFGRKLCVMVHAINPSSLPGQSAAQVEGRAGAARISLLRAGWDVYVIDPDRKLKDIWQPRKIQRRVEVAASSS
jgi:uncharacterized protein (DUF58 family)